MCRLSLIVAIVSVTNPVQHQGEAVSKGVARATLMRVEARLRDVLKDLNPKPEFTAVGDELVVKYRTRPFWVHLPRRDGGYAREASREEGPDTNGFLLSLRYKGDKYSGPLMIPQTLRYPYWSSYVNEYPVGRGKASGGYLWMILSHDVADERIDRIKRCVATVAADAGGNDGGK